MIQVRYKDIDPDSGEVNTDVMMCTCLDFDKANWIKLAIEEQWYGENGPCDPNREFYIIIE